MLELIPTLIKDYGSLGVLIAIILLYMTLKKDINSLKRDINSLRKDMLLKFDMLRRAIYFLADQFTYATSEISRRAEVGISKRILKGHSRAKSLRQVEGDIESLEESINSLKRDIYSLRKDVNFKENIERGVPRERLKGA
ncbi:MAG: hypothetical protein DRN15_10885 [Thermoprotei archaeon]|nr:MAG: hypothetical protein DRN15_10885 [Thermoprotei archaeon]RLF25002.1 MAG: hypothetical protein DRM97_02720 [Thermoprotei archaeon]